jgi:hypothetical protein
MICTSQLAAIRSWKRVFIHQCQSKVLGLCSIRSFDAGSSCVFVRIVRDAIEVNSHTTCSDAPSIYSYDAPLCYICCCPLLSNIYLFACSFVRPQRGCKKQPSLSYISFIRWFVRSTVERMQEATLSFVSFIRWFVRSIVERMQEATLSFVSFGSFVRPQRGCKKQPSLSFRLVRSLVRLIDHGEDARSNPLFRFVYSLVRSFDRREDARSNPLFLFIRWFDRS